MGSNTATAAHEENARMNSHLGATVGAALSGVRDSKLPHRWAEPNGPTPNAGAVARLQITQRIWLELFDAESDHVARTWFISSNPLLGETAP